VIISKTSAQLSRNLLPTFKRVSHGCAPGWPFKLPLGAWVKLLEDDEFRGFPVIPTTRREASDVAVWMAFLVLLIGLLAFGLILTTTELR
jgi:hypothetical protein